MTETLRDDNGEPLFDVDTPMEVIIAHAVAKGIAGFDDYCRQVLLEKKTEGEAGAIYYDLRGEDPEQVVAAAKKILWGDSTNPGHIQKVALCKDLGELRDVNLAQIHRTEEAGNAAVCDAMQSFCWNVFHACTGPSIAIQMNHRYAKPPELIP